MELGMSQVQWHSFQMAEPLPENRLFLYSNGIRKRKIYFNVQYTSEEMRMIQQFRQKMIREKSINIKSDQLILRYLYSSDLNYDKCIEKLVNQNQWFEDSKIQSLDSDGMEILKQGFVYCYGRNRKGYPFLVMDLSIMDLDRFPLIKYYQALNSVLNRVIAQEFQPGVIQTYDFIIDMKNRLLTLPMSAVTSFIGKISDVYSMRLENMKIVNASFAVRMFHKAISAFISEQTNQKICLLSSDDLKQGVLLSQYHKSQLQVKFGGHRPNIDHRLAQTQPQSVTFRGQVDLNETFYSITEQIEEPTKSIPEVAICCGSNDCSIY